MERDNEEISMFKIKFFWINTAQSNDVWPAFMYDTLFIHTEIKRQGQVPK